MDNGTKQLSTVESEQFWTEGQNALQTSPGAETLQPETSTTLWRERGPERRANWHGTATVQDYVRVFDEPAGPGIDIPGVGHVVPIDSALPSPRMHDAGSHDLSPVSLISPDCAGREDAVDEVPEQGDRVGGESPFKETRECLFVELLFVAKDLAEGQIEPATSDETAFCTECIAETNEGGSISHQQACRVGRVLHVIDKLIALARLPQGLDLNLNKKEAAADEGAPGAGDGIRPRGLESFLAVVGGLGTIVRLACPASALTGLETTAAAFGCLLDIYAAPNAESPQGMCDDPAAFRKHFAQIVIDGGAR